jgi:hypothetical protein
MAWAIERFLLQQAIRLRRDDWGADAQLLAEEMFSIFSNIRAQAESFPEIDQNGNPVVNIEVPKIPGDLDIPTLDIAANPTNPPQINPPVVDDGNNDPANSDPTGDSNTQITQKFWHRSTHPGKLTSGNAGSIFQCDVYQNGLNQATLPVQATITDPTLAGDVESGTWVTLFLIAQYEATSQIVSGGALPPKLVPLSVEWLFNAPGQAQGGKTGVVSTPIEGGTADSPGQGKVILRDKVDGNWVTGEEVTVYSTVSGTVARDKDVQMKRVAGDLFVDVEDCGGGEDDE